MKGWVGGSNFYRDKTIRIDNTTYFTTRIHLTRLESDPTRIRDPWTRWSPLPAVRRCCAGRICRWPGIAPTAAHRVRRLPSRGRGDGTACRGLPRDASRVAECRAQALLALPKASTQCRRDLRPVCAHLARDLPRTRAEAATSARISRAAWTKTAEDCCLALRAPSACCRGIACALRALHPNPAEKIGASRANLPKIPGA